MTSRNFEQTLKEILESEALKAGDIIVALDKERPSMLAEAYLLVRWSSFPMLPPRAVTRLIARKSSSLMRGMPCSPFT